MDEHQLSLQSNAVIGFWSGWAVAFVASLSASIASLMAAESKLDWLAGSENTELKTALISLVLLGVVVLIFLMKGLDGFWSKSVVYRGRKVRLYYGNERLLMLSCMGRDFWLIEKKPGVFIHEAGFTVYIRPDRKLARIVSKRFGVREQGPVEWPKKRKHWNG